MMNAEQNAALTSHPAWVCGLKHTHRRFFSSLMKSHPAWVCGLKLGGIIAAGASLGHTLRGCVD